MGLTRTILRPRRSRAAKPERLHDAAFRCLNGVGLLDVVFSELDRSGLHARCLRFAALVTQTPRKTRFRLVARPFAGRDSTRWVRIGRFLSRCLGASTSCFPLPRASPGAMRPDPRQDEDLAGDQLLLEVGHRFGEAVFQRDLWLPAEEALRFRDVGLTDLRVVLRQGALDDAALRAGQLDDALG